MDRILVVAAHPDDETLGAGGTLARHARAGDEISLCILCDVTTSRDRPLDAGALALRREAEEAARILGIAKTHALRYPDNRLDTVPLLDLARVLEQLVQEIEPHVIYTHHRGDLNVDHRLAFEATLVAARPLAGRSLRAVYCYEVPSGTEWSGPWPDRAFLPNVYVNIGETLEAKIQALEAYRSEIRDYPHPRSGQAIRELAKARGLQVGLPFAEAFVLVREIR